ncbi:MAG: hypothetical protein CMD74_02545 [Gammaproteobacteria bacterium]|nr:hypothetical protein [Gammaproteobacteria bacterium]
MTDIQKKNCGGAGGEAFIRVLRPPPKRTRFNPFGSSAQRKWTDDETRRVCAPLGAEIRQITYQKTPFKNGNGFYCGGIYIWFKPGMHPTAVKKWLKGKSVNLTRKIRVRANHDEEKFGKAIEQWIWRLVPANTEPLTKKQLEERRRSRVPELVLSSDSESDEEGDDVF